MDWTTIMDVIFSILGVASFGFLAYGGWLCLRQAGSDRTRPVIRKRRAHAGWPRAARPA